MTQYVKLGPDIMLLGFQVIIAQYGIHDYIGGGYSSMSLQLILIVPHRPNIIKVCLNVQQKPQPRLKLAETVATHNNAGIQKQ